MIVTLTEKAEDDIEAIGDFIARRHPRRLAEMIQELRTCCLGLANGAHDFPLVPRYEAKGIRRRVHGNYLVFYQIRGETIVVLRVLHGAMDYEMVLFLSVPGSP